MVPMISPRALLLSAVALAVLGIGHAPVRAQGSPGCSDCPGSLGNTAAPALATPWSGDASAQTRLILAEGSTWGGGPVWAGIEFKLAPGYVTYWRSPGEGGIPPRFEWGGSENLALSSVRWPVPERVTIGGHELNVYRDHVVLPVRLFPALPDHDLKVSLALHYATCAEVCRPVFAHHEITIPSAAPASPVGPEGFEELIKSYLELVPATVSGEFKVLVETETTLDGGHQLRIIIHTDEDLEAPELFVEVPSETWLGAPEWVASDGETHSFVLALPGTGGGAESGGSITITLVDGDFIVEAIGDFEPPEPPELPEVPEPPEPPEPPELPEPPEPTAPQE